LKKSFKYLFILSILFSCNESKVHRTPEVFDTADLKLFTVDFLISTIRLPHHYEKLTYETLFELAAMDDSQIDINFLLQSAKEYRDKEHKPVFFRDRALPNNFIVFYPYPYTEISKAEASYWSSQTLAGLQRQDRQLGTRTTLIEKKIKRTETKQLIKVKVHQEYVGKSNYLTQYYVTGNLKTFTVVVANRFDIDFEEHIKRMPL